MNGCLSKKPIGVLKAYTHGCYVNDMYRWSRDVSADCHDANVLQTSQVFQWWGLDRYVPHRLGAGELASSDHEVATR